MAGIDSARYLSAGQVLRKLRSSSCRRYDILRESRITRSSLRQNLAPVSTVGETEQQQQRDRPNAKARSPIETDRLFGRRMELQSGWSVDRFNRRLTILWAVILWFHG